MTAMVMSGRLARALSRTPRAAAYPTGFATSNIPKRFRSGNADSSAAPATVARARQRSISEPLAVPMAPVNAKGRFFDMGNGFWHLKGDIVVLGLNLGTQMSLIKLDSGKFLVVDTCALSSAAKQQLDELTNNGENIEAVIATHPFHTVYFPTFYKQYTTPKYYGCPRHLKTITSIPWAGDLSDEAVRNQWEPEVSMRIPDGCEFVAPSESIHFASVFLFHKRSRIIHDDDTLMFLQGDFVSCGAGCLFSLVGQKTNALTFHPSLKWGGLLPTADAPWQFKAFIEKIIADWDFDTVCASHCGVMESGAKAALVALLASHEKDFKMLSEKYFKK